MCKHIGHVNAMGVQSSKSGRPYGQYAILLPRYGPYSEVGKYSIEDNIGLILAWVHILWSYFSLKSYNFSRLNFVRQESHLAI